jgi:hypothetical protein
VSILGLKQDYSGKHSKMKWIAGSQSPNGKMHFMEASRMPAFRSWQLEIGPTPPLRIEGREPTASPKYPFGIDIYSPGRISLGKTAELCGLYYDEIVDEMQRRGLHFHFGPRTLSEAEQELESIRRHMRRRP